MYGCFLVLQANYGQCDADKVEKVKTLYREMDLPRVYAEYEESSYRDLLSLINISSGSLPPGVFTAFAQKIYKRKS